MADLKLSAIFSATVCMLTSIPNKSDSKVFELSEKFQRCAVVREGGNRRFIPAEENRDIKP